MTNRLKEISLEWESDSEKYYMYRNEFRQLLLDMCIEVAMKHNFAEAFADRFESGEIILSKNGE